jgi:hypothetical protein
MTKIFSSTLGKLGATVAGTDPRYLAAIPNFNWKKGDSK